MARVSPAEDGAGQADVVLKAVVGQRPVAVAVRPQVLRHELGAAAGVQHFDDTRDGSGVRGLDVRHAAVQVPVSPAEVHVGTEHADAAVGDVSARHLIVLRERGEVVQANLQRLRVRKPGVDVAHERRTDVGIREAVPPRRNETRWGTGDLTAEALPRGGT